MIGIPTIFCTYGTIYKIYTGQTPFIMVYGKEAVVSLHVKQQKPEIAQVLKLDLIKAKKYRLFQLQKFEEDKLYSFYHQEVKKRIERMAG